jgi:cob(I)alamin adenosyltransferase
MSISTKTGDDGTSGLLFNRRVSKTDARIEACGSVDEFSAALGLARAAAGPGSLNDEILRIQKELVLIMGELALLDEDRPRYEVRRRYIDPAAAERLTTLVHEGETKISFKDWATPGGNPPSAAFDFARTVCRRAERRVLMLRESQPALNRLSDLCWIWARLAETPDQAAKAGS